MRDPMPQQHRRDNTPAGVAGACHPRDPHTEILRVALMGVNLGGAPIPVRVTIPPRTAISKRYDLPWGAWTARNSTD